MQNVHAHESVLAHAFIERALHDGAELAKEEMLRRLGRRSGPLRRRIVLCQLASLLIVCTFNIYSSHLASILLVCTFNIYSSRLASFLIVRKYNIIIIYESRKLGQLA